MKYKKIIVFIILFNLLSLFIFINECKPLHNGALETKSQEIFIDLYSLYRHNSKYNDIAPNTAIDGIYVIYIEKKSNKNSPEQIKFDFSIEGIADYLSMQYSESAYGYYCIIEVNSSDITKVYTTTEK